ncbi:MAG: acyltransferase [Acidobacteriaceae bacterium]|nr:acyltransferase [Acidobacteriaceae bacterium]
MAHTEQQVSAEGSPYRRHLPGLDGLRGLSVLGVLVAHLLVMPAVTRAGGVAQAFVRFCGMGVVVFFVLSGFLITGILYESLEEEGFFRKFYVRRILRIAPIYYLVILVLVGTVLFAGKQYGHQPLSLALYLQNTSVVAPPIWEYNGVSKLPMLHFWTLAVEEQFYLLWPVLLFLLRDRRAIAWAAVGGSLLSIVLRYWMVMGRGASDEAVHCMTMCRLDTLLLGALLAMLVRTRWHDHTLRSACWLLPGGLGLTWGCYGVSRWHVAPMWLQGAVFSLSYTGYAIASAGLLLFALRRGGGVSERFFEMKWLRWLGRYSYGIYVLHYIFHGLWSEAWRAWLAGHGLRGTPGACLEAVAMAAFSIAVAVASYELYEKRFLKLKRFVQYTGVVAKSV